MPPTVEYILENGTHGREEIPEDSWKKLRPLDRAIEEILITKFKEPLRQFSYLGTKKIVWPDISRFAGSVQKPAFWPSTKSWLGHPPPVVHSYESYGSKRTVYPGSETRTFTKTGRRES